MRQRGPCVGGAATRYTGAMPERIDRVCVIGAGPGGLCVAAALQARGVPFDILDAEGTPTRTIFHCFTGGPDEARSCLDRGAYVSFSGIVTFKSAADVQAAARLVPADRMLIETDAPYLAPVPHRGKTNQPAWVAHTARYLADLRDEPLLTVAEATFANGLAAFPKIRT